MPRAPGHESFREAQIRLSALHWLSRNKRLVSALLLAVIFAAPAAASDNQKPKLRLKRVSLDRVDWNNRSAQTKLTVEINNPGPAFKLTDLSYRLRLNDEEAAKGSYEKDVTVPRGSAVTVDLPCTVDLTAVPGVAWGVILGGFELRYELNTQFTVASLPLFSPRLTTTQTGEVSLTRTVSGWTAQLRDRLYDELR